MWKQLIAPTLFVAGLWLVVSPTMTYFTLWLDENYQRALTRNLTAMHSSGQVCEVAWRILSNINSANPNPDEFLQRLPEMIRSVEEAHRQLRSLRVSDDEDALIDRMEANWQAMIAELRLTDGAQVRNNTTVLYRKLRDHARAINATANELRQVNQQVWLSADRHHDHWKGVIAASRFIIVVVGPAIGIALGWWISKRVHRSISQINIILKGANVEWERSLAEIRVSGREDLTELRQRVERVVERLREVNSELELARRESLRAERLAAVGALAAGVAHELRNPMTSVKLLLQNAAQQPHSIHIKDEEAQVILEEVSRMENTIQGLLDFSRPPSSQRQRHDFRHTLQRGLNLVQGRAKQHQVHIRTRLPDQPLMVDGDPDQLHQLCVNVLINGIEANSGGTLEIDAEENFEEKVIRARFRDFGPGLPDHVLRHLFEPFVSTKSRGTGLGLAISRRIVIHHGGSLVAENVDGGGAMFTIELPLVSDEGLEKPSRHTVLQGG